MHYQIRYTGEARHALQNMPGNYRQRARRLIESLFNTPRPATAKELRDLPNRYRIRLNGWRIIYRVDDEDGVIIILRIRQKSGPETYTKLE